MLRNTTEPFRTRSRIIAYSILAFSIITFLYLTNIISFPVDSVELDQWGKVITDEYAISIRYSSKWSFVSSPEGRRGDPTVITLISGSQNSPYITVAKYPEKTNEINNLLRWVENRLEQREEYREVSFEDRKIVGLPEYQIREYQFTDGLFFIENLYHCYDWYPIHNQLGYQFSFCSVEEEWDMLGPVFIQMIASVRFGTD